MATVKKAWTSPGKMQKITRLSRGLKSASNWKTAGIGIAADWGADQLVDRAFKPLMERKLGKKLTLSEYRSITQEALNRKREKKVTTKDLQKGKETKNKRGRTVKTEKPVGRNWQNPYKGPEQPTTKTVTKERIEKQKAQSIGKADKTNKEPAKVIGKTDEKSNVNNLKVSKSGGQGNQQKNQKTSNTPYWQSPRYSSVKKKKTEAELKKEWLKKTRNSPARKSGAFTDDQLWKQHKKHQKWKKANNRR
jgi:hypothetical protein